MFINIPRILLRLINDEKIPNNLQNNWLYLIFKRHLIIVAMESEFYRDIKTGNQYLFNLIIPIYCVFIFDEVTRDLIRRNNFNNHFFFLFCKIHIEIIQITFTSTKSLFFN